MGFPALPICGEVYGLYHNPEQPYKSIVQRENANDIFLSSIAKEAKPVAILSFNKSGYSSYCREYWEYREYWEWVEKRNDACYLNTLSHGKNYDAKNMMPTFRLLTMAEEIGKEGTINVRRADQKFLLSIKREEFEYEKLVQQAEAKIAEIVQVYENSILFEKPDLVEIEQLLVGIRAELCR